jgi:hypothetical protein
MSTPFKILLTLPGMIGLAYLIKSFGPGSAGFIGGHENDVCEYVVGEVLIVVQLVYILRRLWSWKTLTRRQKWEWTGLIIFPLYPIAATYYIWHTDDVFAAHEQQDTLHSKT